MIVSTAENFIQPAIQGTVSAKRRYNLTDDYRFEWEENGTRYARTVYMMDADCACETETDLASVPDSGPLGAIAGTIGIDQSGPSDGGSVIHDNSYQRRGVFKPGEFQVLTGDQWLDCIEKFSRLRADKLYFKMLILGGMSRWKACLEFVGLRAAGVKGITKKGGVKWFFS